MKCITTHNVCYLQEARFYFDFTRSFIHLGNTVHMFYYVSTYNKF